MQFNSTLFLFFVLPLTVIVHLLLRKTRLQNAWLLLISLLFFGWCSPKGLAFLVVYALCNYAVARLIASAPPTKKLWVAVGVLLDLGLLFVYKYFNFAASVTNQFLGTQIGALKLVQPMGISFLTFTTIAYVIDVYRGKVAPITSFADFLLYLSFFPKAAQGPITRASEFTASLAPRNPSLENISAGLSRFIVGLAKKCLIADVLGKSVDLVFENLSTGVSCSTAWIGILYYTLQIFYDFSGYTDMAIGIGQMLGFTLPENFRSPYRSLSVSEFWRRWHMTLGSWFKEYLYIPLGGNRKGLIRTFVNLGVVWMATGIWHGAAYNYILWGIYYGILIMTEKAINNTAFYYSLPKPVKWGYTFFAVAIGWVLFRCGSLDQINQYLTTMFGMTSGQLVMYGTEYFFDIPSLLAFIPGVIFLLPCPAKLSGLSQRSATVYWLRNLALALLLILSIIFMVNSSYTSFIYFQF